jgi:trans-aconitate methyltransferase
MIMLSVIAERYGTDKLTHGYCPAYELLLGGMQPKSLLEIGIFKGNSLRMWRDYFADAMIYGLDIDPNTAIEETRIKCFIGRQEDEAFINQVTQEAGPFDVIIDDGSHHARDHLSSFKFLWPHLSHGGWYVIEDLHSLYDPCWTRPRETTIINLVSHRFQRILVGGDEISQVHLFGGNWDDGILFLKKRDCIYKGRN